MPVKEAVKIYKDQLKSSLDSLTKKKLEFKEKEQQQEEKISGVREEARRTRRINDYVQELTVTDAALEVEKFDHPYLLNTVLGETTDVINQVSVTLDVETTNRCLEVSEDRKSVRWTRNRRDLPDTGRRFTNWACVQGSEGFTSGRHYWEVAVNRGWYLGVAAKSVERKRVVSPSPSTGFWVTRRADDMISVLTSHDVMHRNSVVISDEISNWSCIAACLIPRRVGVYLSYESGTVSFYNAESKSHLHTFTGNKFRKKLYPFSATWDGNQWLRICSGPAPAL
ncbi:E3 ubiquitin-protein ligase TRIM39-like isoform X2 [Mobula birostris]|uniref:E3 ubiquitin-protein ligase TRIM39-like isoform X2 n=1 Tax=Mobula birostris TaxID=1983395 RepID=UPI003B287F80